MFSQKELSWKPRRYGRCTWADYNHAVRSATRLAAAAGVGFKSRVWENLGWHFAADRVISKQCRITVRQQSRGFEAELYSVGLQKQWFASGRTPANAVRNVIADARKDCASLMQALKKL